MVSINLNEDPAAHLVSQAKIRIQYLRLMILIWAGVMICLGVWSGVESNNASEKVTLLEKRLRDIEPQLERQQLIHKKIQAQAQWICAYESLQALLNHPVQGVYFSLIDYSGTFSLEGQASTQISLDRLKEIMSQYFQESDWEIFPQKNTLVFYFKGKPIC